MEKINNYITEKLKINKDSKNIQNNNLKEKDKSWSETDFDDTIVNYYLLNFIESYQSLAGMQKQEYKHFFIIWDEDKLPKEELEKLINKRLDKNKNDIKIIENALEVKRDTLKNIYKQMKTNNQYHCWSDIISINGDKINNVYFVDA